VHKVQREKGQRPAVRTSLDTVGSSTASWPYRLATVAGSLVSSAEQGGSPEKQDPAQKKSWFHQFKASQMLPSCADDVLIGGGQGFFFQFRILLCVGSGLYIGTVFGSGFWLRPAANMTCLALASDSFQDAACTGTAAAIVLVLAECVMLVSSQQPLGQLPSTGRGTCSNTLFSSGTGPGPEGLALRPNNNTPQSQARRADWLSFGAESQKKLWGWPIPW
jgi:hypothetical protein